MTTGIDPECFLEIEMPVGEWGKAFLLEQPPISAKIVTGAVQPSCHLATVPDTIIPVQNIACRGNVRIERGNCAETVHGKKLATIESSAI